ncbi:MAG: tRNA (adenosine(37)-N6)-threonylcarbamoyltransferase complex ATPase subunit type 1 TsaE [Ignavibacteria bacterium]|nr:tRNA (adenosine(37)-N6)-threonylcarbamoyltransferase complex ATPase subunit type 1 TsaE [Ignavibacteria bacterium]
MITINSKSPGETLEAGKNYAEKYISEGDIIGLNGELGSGKTVFVKGVAAYFSVKDIVNSPTYLIVNEYKGVHPVSKISLNIYHFDFYRINNLSEFDIIGFKEYLKNDNSVSIIEWSCLAEKYLNITLKKVYFNYGNNENSRIIKY